jgi:N-acetylglucosamine-6-phosphate deacetylase
VKHQQLFIHAIVYAEAHAVSLGGTAGDGEYPTAKDTSAPDRYVALPNGAVVVEDGKIMEIIADRSMLDGRDLEGYEVIDLEGKLLIPGFVDVHVHGGGGYDVMAGEVTDIQGMSRFHASHGTTTILPTTLTADQQSIERAVRSIVMAMEQGAEGADIVGIHLEGPFISPHRCGAQHPDHIREPSIEELDAYLRLAEGHVKLITAAPERPHAMEMIRHAVQHGVTVSIGHSDATFEVVQEAVRQGASHVTHLFNGMRPLHHREPGVAGGALMLDELSVELICDGWHVHRDLVEFVFRVKPDEKVVLITDAMSAAGLPDGDDYQLGGLPCYKADGQVRLKSSGDLAGSCLTLDAALRNVMQFTGRSLAEVLPTLTINPARAVGIDGRKGSIAPGKDADFAVLDDHFQVAATFVRGKCVYSSEAERGLC